MMKITIERTGAGEFRLPDIKLDKKAFEDIGGVVCGDIVNRIQRGRQADGGAIKRNKPGTLARKAKLGQGARSLIADKLRFIRPGQGGSFRYWAHADRVIVEPGSQELKDLVRYVQQKGYTGWFGVSKTAFGTIRRIIVETIKRIVRKAAKK